MTPRRRKSRQYFGEKLLLFATRHGLSAIANQIRRTTPASTRSAAAVATAGLQWPPESYAQARKERGENIVQFLTRVWLPLIRAGAVSTCGPYGHGIRQRQRQSTTEPLAETSVALQAGQTMIVDVVALCVLVKRLIGNNIWIHNQL